MNRHHAFATTIILATSLAAICGCGGRPGSADTKSSGQASMQAESTTPADGGDLLPDDLFFMLQDEALPQEVDTTQDISRLSYSQLRLLRSYVYAIHGHWFMEGDLNNFFCRHTRWYFDYTYDKWDDFDYSRDTARAQLTERYFKALYSDDPTEAYAFFDLTPGELAFVGRIDARMDSLSRHKQATSPEGISLLNPDMAVNHFQLYRPDTCITRLLRTHNMALQPSTCQQLFNIYEANNYHCIPSFVTTDVMLQATHMYFSYVLKSIERHDLVQSLYSAMANLLRTCDEKRLCMCPEMRNFGDIDLAVYCAVALKLLGADPMRMFEGLDHRLLEYGKDLYDRELALVENAQDAPSPLFRTKTDFPYSLFKPRGHYTRSDESARYFRAMMWIQKGCFMREDGDQLYMAANLATLINDTPLAQFHLRRLNQAITFLMGRPDNVSVLDLAVWMRSEMPNPADLDDKEQMGRIDEWLREQFRDANRIRPKVDTDGMKDELNLMPSRYTSDGEILATLYDPKPDAPRAYPSGLDVMDAMGVKEATSILSALNKQQPWTDYDRLRDEQFRRCEKFSGWNNTLYDKWTHILCVMQEGRDEQPAYMKTKAWRRKQLNTALASWALLKHDAVLYAEQPMAAECGGGGLPEPTYLGYVEPNLPFWKELESLLTITQDMLRRNNLLTETLERRGGNLADIVAKCRQAAEKELSGQPLTEQEHADIHHLGSTLEWFTLSVIDPDETYPSWDVLEGADRCVAQVSDVFTRNVPGCGKNGILYEAAGLPMEIYVVVEIDGRCYLTRGATYSYYEFVRPLGDRLTDEQWQEMLYSGKGVPPLPEWIQPYLTRKPARADERFVYSAGC